MTLIRYTLISTGIILTSLAPAFGQAEPPPPPPPPTFDNQPAMPQGIPGSVPIQPSSPEAPSNQPMPPAEQGTLLRYHYKAGQSIHYRITGIIDGAVASNSQSSGIPFKEKIEMVIHQNVNSVNPDDHTATLAIGVDKATFTMNGETQPLPAAKLAAMKDMATLTITSDGKILSMKTNAQASVGGIIPGGPDFDNLSVLMSTGMFSATPVSEGSGWRSETRVGDTGSKIASSYLLKKLSTENDKQIAKIEQKTAADISLPPSTAARIPMKTLCHVTGTGTIDFNVTEGLVDALHNNSKVKLTLIPNSAPTAVPKAKTKAATTNQMKINLNVDTTLQRLPAYPEKS